MQCHFLSLLESFQKSHGKIKYNGNHPTLQNNRHFPQAVYKSPYANVSSSKNLLVNPITHENMFTLILPGVGCDDIPFVLHEVFTADIRV